jgi:uncharacterized membrane protein YhaH (DUF805 family)
MEWAILPLRKYADFTGRARRKEYWLFMLLLVLVFAAVYGVEGILELRQAIGPYGLLTTLYQLAILLPMLAVGARRLHDTGRSGWWQLIAFGPLLLSSGLPLAGLERPALVLSLIALIGLVVLLVLAALEGRPGANRYGPDPRRAAAA